MNYKQSQHCIELRILNSQASILKSAKRGMTLVELLVVITIMVILVTVSIPVFKPMLESQRAAGAARVVAGTLQRVRVKAMQERKTYGLEFVRFGTAGTPEENLSIQMRLKRENSAWATPEQLRVVVIDGTIHVCALWDEVNGGPPTPPATEKMVWSSNPGVTFANRQLWSTNVQNGFQIRLGRQGRTYTVLRGDNGTPDLPLDDVYTLAAPYADLTLPDGIDPNTTATIFNTAVEATVTRPAVSAFAPPVVLPRGTIVDLMYSGEHFSEAEATDPVFPANLPQGHRLNFAGAGPVAIMFSPAGFVDGIANDSGNVNTTNRMIYFCIGEWERQSLSTAGDTYAEDGLNNLLMPSNYWVSVHPRSGQVRVTQLASAPETAVAPSPSIDAWRNAAPADKPQVLQKLVPGVRKFAAEHYVDVGGF